jgi:hypothetical protein
VCTCYRTPATQMLINCRQNRYENEKSNNRYFNRFELVEPYLQTEQNQKEARISLTLNPDLCAQKNQQKKMYIYFKPRVLRDLNGAGGNVTSQ